jgi:hypothetical protein
MGIFDVIKNKILRRDDDFSDMRSHVLGEPDTSGLPPPPEPGMRAGQQGMNPQEPAPENLGPPPEQDLGPLPDSLEELGPTDLSKPIDEGPLGPVKEPMEIEPGNERDIREIIHRLDFIENQLSAIKSQTETVNERLKNIEVKIDRRYR